MFSATVSRVKQLGASGEGEHYTLSSGIKCNTAYPQCQWDTLSPLQGPVFRHSFCRALNKKIQSRRRCLRLATTSKNSCIPAIWGTLQVCTMSSNTIESMIGSTRTMPSIKQEVENPSTPTHNYHQVCSPSTTIQHQEVIFASLFGCVWFCVCTRLDAGVSARARGVTWHGIRAWKTCLFNFI